MNLLCLFFCLIVVAADDTDLNTFITSNQKFLLAVYQDNPQWVKNDTGFLLSPFSAEIALAMIQAGAKGDTADQIRSSTYLPSTEEELETVMKTVRTTFQEEISTKIFVQKNFTINDSFKTTTNEVYQTTFQTLDFVQADNYDATDIIKQWMKDHTDQKIDGGFIATTFNSYTKDVLVNTFLIQKDWAMKFDPSQTKNETFHGSTHDSYRATMTQGPYQFNYFESVDLDAKMLEIPFDDGDSSLTIVLPNTVTGLARVERDIETALTTPQWSQEFMQLSLPMFSFNMRNMNFTPIMNRLGATNAFTQDKADLSGIGGDPGELAISTFDHYTYMDFNENGLEAISAQLAEAILSRSSRFDVNKPFLFYVKVKGVVVFVGRVL